MHDVTIIMTQRERFGLQRRSLESLIANTKTPFDLVIVDGGSPEHLAAYLRKLAHERGDTLIRRDYVLTPNEARNLAIPHATTPYVAFVDNDVLFTEGWLEALLAAAAETDADIVSPITCIGDPPHCRVHHAGGRIQFHEENGRRTIKDVHRYMDVPLKTIRSELERGPTDYSEFHTVLVRRALLDRLGPMDEKLMTSREHIDFCMSARALGAKIIFEPNSVVTYYAPPPMSVRDYPFYVARWNDDWSVASMRHFMRKWDVWFDIEELRKTWIKRHRDVALEPIRKRLQVVLGWRMSHRLKKLVEDRIAERVLRSRPDRNTAIDRP